MSENYPNELYRGITSTDAFLQNGFITAAAFQFSDYKGEHRNDDGYCEMSINWADDEKSLDILLNQKKPFKDDFQFKFGYCKINKQIIDAVFATYIKTGDFKYERRPIKEDIENCIEENPYHGNLLLLNSADKQIKKNIQCTLATIAGTIIKRE